MPRNGSGVYSPPAANYPAVTGTTITAANRNAVDADIATALTGSVAVNGESVITANLPMAGFKLTGLGAGASNGDSLRYQQLFTTSAVTLLGALNMVKGADIASASTIDLTAATGNAVHVTGTTTITAVTLGSGMWRLVIFDAALTLTHHATNNNLPGGANITTAAGDRAIYWSDGTTVYCISYVTQSRQNVNSNHLSGMRVTNDAIDATNDIDIAAGNCRDSTDTLDIVQPSALVKQLDAGWAAGTNQGMRNSAAAITDTTYHIYAVCKAGGANPDYYAHTSLTVATVLTALQAETGGSAYVYARRIFSIMRSSGAIIPFLQTGDHVMWQTQKPDVTAAANTSVTNRTLTIPLGLKVEVIIGAGAFSSGSVNSTLVCDPDLTNRTASTNATNLYNESGVSAACEIRCMSNTSSQVSTHGTGTGALISIRTLGYVDRRGKTD